MADRPQEGLGPVNGALKGTDTWSLFCKEIYKHSLVSLLFGP